MLKGEWELHQHKKWDLCELHVHEMLIFPSCTLYLYLVKFVKNWSDYDTSCTSVHYNPLIFLAHILCVHVRKSDEMYASPTWCTHAKKKKKNATEVTEGLRVNNAAEPSSRGRHPCAHRLFLPKESSHKFAVYFL